MSQTTRPTALLYCELRRGLDHWMRTVELAKSLARSSRVVIAVTTEFPVSAPPDVELVTFRERGHFPCYTEAGEEKAPLGGHLIALAEHIRPSVIVLEYFPFGREKAAIYLVPFLAAMRRTSFRPAIVASMRDQGEGPLARQDEFDGRVVSAVNRLFDMVLVHADPAITTLAATFARASDLDVPVHHTGYLLPALPAVMLRDRERRVLVSAGGGRDGMDLLASAIAAQRTTALGRDYQMRVVAGPLRSDTDWQRLVGVGAGVPGLELVRSVPDLAAELRGAAVSVTRGGYGTLLDVVRTGTPGVVVPHREAGDDEQWFRARRFEEFGGLRLVGEHELAPETLAAAIREAVALVPRPPAIEWGGADRSAAAIDELVRNSGRPSARAPAGPASSTPVVRA